MNGTNEFPVKVADIPQAAWEYWVDAWQRSLLFLQVMQERSARYHEHAAKTVPHVLKFDPSLVMDGRKLARPVNYALVRIIPPKGMEIDERKRPFIVLDPRAGHGPGIGGFKADSEIGVVCRAGHPCYFVGFLPEPVPGQTIEDIAHAEAAFVERVAALHPQAEGKPAVVGNCQAGWAVMLLAALQPELLGPIIVAGAPLSYWTGVHGQYPMRYTAGLLGGSWLTALANDLGHGKFDGAWLVSNFENLNPANTLWKKNYNLYRKIDTEAPRFLEFEQWWGGHVLLNADEIQFIVDELFIGNKLASGDLLSSNGTRIDFRNIRSPIIVFCSKADDITPPQQALGWILDLYDSVDDIRAHGQTIVYALHETAGHLGIFVSSAVAKKEHNEFANNIDLIDALPPGLYQAVLTPKDTSDPSTDFVGGDYLVRFHARTLDDIRALGGNDEDDDRKFAAVARLSEINLGLYRTCLQPFVHAWSNEGSANWMRRLHPLRLQYELFATANPFLNSFGSTVDTLKDNRRPLTSDNVFWQAQEMFSKFIEESLQSYGEIRDRMAEAWFHAVYGSPVVQALLGLRASDAKVRHGPGKSPADAAAIVGRLNALKAKIPNGGPREAALRALLYIRMPEGAIDERGFNFLRRAREEAGEGLTLAEFKQLVREQYLMLLLDERRAIAAIPAMLAEDKEAASGMADKVRKMIDVVGITSSSSRERLAEIEALFDRTLHQARPVARRERRAPEPAERMSSKH